MTAPQVVQIAPHGPGGVADHVQQLRLAWQAQGLVSQEWRLAQADVVSQSLADRLWALDATQFNTAPASATSRAPTTCIVVLHFSGYGYAPRGLCHWLLDELQAARQQLGPRLVLATVFHELYASGAPWRSAFWTGPLQARIAARLARLSDHVRTNTSHHHAFLSRHARAPVAVLPVFSNVGQCESPAPVSQRDPVMVVFGGSSTRQRAFDGVRGLGAALRALGVQQLLEAGSGPASRWPADLPPCRHLGALESEPLARLLQSSRFGLVDYQGRHLGKSGVVAAYAAHGCAIVNSQQDLQPADGLQPGRDYHGLRQTAAADRDAAPAWDAMARSAHAWYGGHDVKTQAAQWLQLFASAQAGRAPEASGRAAA